MANTCTILRRIERLSQRLADFLSRPKSLNRSAINRLIDDLEMLRAAVRELPLSRGPKNDILNRIAQAQRLLRNRNIDEAIDRILAVLAVLQVVTVKVNSHKVPCAQGLTIVHPSKPFSTICQICDP